MYWQQPGSKPHACHDQEAARLGRRARAPHGRNCAHVASWLVHGQDAGPEGLQLQTLTHFSPRDGKDVTMAANEELSLKLHDSAPSSGNTDGPSPCTNALWGPQTYRSPSPRSENSCLHRSFSIRVWTRDCLSSSRLIKKTFTRQALETDMAKQSGLQSLPT